MVLEGWSLCLSPAPGALGCGEKEPGSGAGRKRIGDSTERRAQVVTHGRWLQHWSNDTGIKPLQPRQGDIGVLVVCSRSGDCEGGA